jgi:hypothetical protein
VVSEPQVIANFMAFVLGSLLAAYLVLRMVDILLGRRWIGRLLYMSRLVVNFGLSLSVCAISLSVVVRKPIANDSELLGCAIGMCLIMLLARQIEKF